MLTSTSAVVRAAWAISSVLFVLALPSTASATYSIAACDSLSGACGVAVQTNNLAVGASVPSARAGVGAVASQFETNPSHGALLLTLLEQGTSPEAALRKVLSEDNFEGQGAEARQVAVVASNGQFAVHTGELARSAVWAGSRSRKGYSIQGNGLAGEMVVQAMEDAFLKSAGPLEARLLAALAAGDAAGGQSTGKQSAALLLRTLQGWPVDIDLRVDHSSQPVQDLQALYGMHVSRQTLLSARRELQRGNFAQAASLMKQGVRLAPHWPRTLIQASQIALALQEQELSLQYLTEAFHVGPEWRASEIGKGRYALLGSMRGFRRFVTPQERSAVMARYRSASASVTPQTVELVQSLLEVGETKLARSLIDKMGASDPETVFWLAVIEFAEGNNKEALQRVREGLANYPLDRNLQLYSKHLARGSR